MTLDDALAFVERRGVVLEAARHATIPSLAETIAGEPLHGGWWSHPQGRAIFAITRAVRDANDVLVCRLVDGKITFVHARLWPALAHLATRFPPTSLARVREVHMPGGAHRVEEIPFPAWLPAETIAAAAQLDERAARSALGSILEPFESVT